MVARAAGAERRTNECSRWGAREAVGGRKGGTAARAGRRGPGRGGAGRRARPDGSSPEKAPAARVPVSAGNSAPCPTLALQTRLCDLCSSSEPGLPGKDPCPLPRVFAAWAPPLPPSRARGPGLGAGRRQLRKLAKSTLHLQTILLLKPRGRPLPEALHRQPLSLSRRSPSQH